MSALGENAELAKTVLNEYYQGFQSRNPNLYVFSAHLHMDVATPHLHIDFVPFITGSLTHWWSRQKQLNTPPEAKMKRGKDDGKVHI